MARREHEGIPEVLVIFCFVFLCFFYIWVLCSGFENFELDTYMNFSVHTYIYIYYILI